MEEVVWLWPDQFCRPCYSSTHSHAGISSPSHSGTPLDIEKKVSGEIEIPNLSDEHDIEDVDVSWEGGWLANVFSDTL